MKIGLISIDKMQIFAAFKTILKPAIVLKDTAVRSFPTNERLFLSNKPGEGYPFDYLQDSI